MEKGSRPFNQCSNISPRSNVLDNMQWFPGMFQQNRMSGISSYMYVPDSTNFDHSSGMFPLNLQSHGIQNSNHSQEFYNEPSNLYKSPYGPNEPIINHKEGFNSRGRSTYSQSTGNQNAVDLRSTSSSCFALSREADRDYWNQTQKPVTVSDSIYPMKFGKAENIFSSSVKDMSISDLFHHSSVEQLSSSSGEKSLIQPERSRHVTNYFENPKPKEIQVSQDHQKVAKVQSNAKAAAAISPPAQNVLYNEKTEPFFLKRKHQEDIDDYSDKTDEVIDKPTNSESVETEQNQKQNQETKTNKVNEAGIQSKNDCIETEKTQEQNQQTKTEKEEEKDSPSKSSSVTTEQNKQQNQQTETTPVGKKKVKVIVLQRPKKPGSGAGLSLRSKVRGTPEAHSIKTDMDVNEVLQALHGTKCSPIIINDAKIGADLNTGVQSKGGKIKMKSLLNSKVHYVDKGADNVLVKNKKGQYTKQRKLKNKLFRSYKESKDSPKMRVVYIKKPVLNCAVCCKDHDTLTCSEDEPLCHMLDNVSYSNATIRSLVTLPNQLYLGASGDSVYGLGVFCKIKIQKATQFGPVIGETLAFKDISPGMDFRHIWYFARDKEWKNLMFINTEDEQRSNWCRYLRPSFEKKRCNLVCISRDESLFFLSRRSIKAGEELIFYHKSLDEFKSSRIQMPTQDSSQEEKEAHTNTCTVCKVSFSDGVSYLKHCQVYHTFKTKEIRSQCRVCFEAFLSKKQLLVHCKTFHNGAGGEFICAVCGKGYVYQPRLKDHIRNAHMEDPLECDECGHTYLNERRLRQHKYRAHSKGIWRCDKCNKQFVNRQVLLKHKRIHEELYTSACDRCGKLFRDKNNLKVHLLTHSGVKPFRCEQEGCTAAFTIKQCLQVHYRKTHGYSDENMPEITRSVPFTTDAYLGQEEKEEFHLDMGGISFSYEQLN